MQTNNHIHMYMCVGAEMPLTFLPGTTLLWICMEMVLLLLFSILLCGVVWFVMNRYHENCYSCEEQMPILQNRLREYERQMNIINKEHERQMNITNKEHERHLNIMNAKHKRELNKAEAEYKRQIDIMYEREMVIINQAHLIKRFRSEMHEAQKSMDQYVANIDKYRELEATSKSWLYSLSREEEEYMNRLRDYLGLDRISDLDLKGAAVIVRQGAEQTLKILSSWLEQLEVALSKMDIDKMKQLQTILNEMEDFAVLNSQMECVRSRITNELQAKGAFYQISSAFYNLIIATLDMQLVIKILKIMMQ